MPGELRNRPSESGWLYNHSFMVFLNRSVVWKTPGVLHAATLNMGGANLFVISPVDSSPSADRCPLRRVSTAKGVFPPGCVRWFPDPGAEGPRHPPELISYQRRRGAPLLW